MKVDFEDECCCGLLNIIFNCCCQVCNDNRVCGELYIGAGGFCSIIKLNDVKDYEANKIELVLNDFKKLWLYDYSLLLREGELEISITY